MKTHKHPFCATAFSILTSAVIAATGAARADIYMAGDSTMCNYPSRAYPQQGWGQALALYMKEPKILHNSAVGELKTGNISFENVGGRICITENLAVAGYGGKASGPGSLKSPKDIKMKSSFTIYAAELDATPSDVVPDLIYTQHYGF